MYLSPALPIIHLWELTTSTSGIHGPESRLHPLRPAPEIYRRRNGLSTLNMVRNVPNSALAYWIVVKPVGIFEIRFTDEFDEIVAGCKKVVSIKVP